MPSPSVPSATFPLLHWGGEGQGEVGPRVPVLSSPMLSVTHTIHLEDSELVFTFLRAPGPGGQNVNKTESAVQLRFDARASPSLPPEVYARLRPFAGRRMTTDGVIVITANRFRSQPRNRDDALARLVEMIRKAAIPPKRRRATKPSRASKRRRLEGKRKRSELKKTRGRVSGE